MKIWDECGWDFYRNLRFRLILDFGLVNKRDEGEGSRSTFFFLQNFIESQRGLLVNDVKLLNFHQNSYRNVLKFMIFINLANLTSLTHKPLKGNFEGGKKNENALVKIN